MFFRQVREHSNKVQSNALWLWLFFFYSTGAVRCFNSQEKQLKAGTGLTYTQWSKIDQQHPAWTNHSTEGEASKQTWKVQEAMTGLMVWKTLLMIEEKGGDSVFTLLFTFPLEAKITSERHWSFLLETLKDGQMGLGAPLNVTLLLYSHIFSSSERPPPARRHLAMFEETGSRLYRHEARCHLDPMVLNHRLKSPLCKLLLAACVNYHPPTHPSVAHQPSFWEQREQANEIFQR